MRYGYTRFDFRDTALSHADRKRLPSWFSDDLPDTRVMADLEYRNPSIEMRFRWLKAGDELYLPQLSALAASAALGAQALLWLSQRGVKVWTSEIQGFLSAEMIAGMAEIGGAG